MTYNFNKIYLLILILIPALVSAKEIKVPQEYQQRILAQYPALDLDKDGFLSFEEIITGQSKTSPAFQFKIKKLLKKLVKQNQDRSAKNEINPESFLNQLGLKAERNIEYKVNTKQQRNKLDIIYPKNKVYEKAPLFIYIHGGGNTGGSKSSIYKQGAAIVKELTQAGIAVASIDYRLLGKGEVLGFQQLFEDCKDALRFLAKNAERFGIDRHKFITWGTSAGGSKSLISALTKYDFLEGAVKGANTEHTVIGGIAFYGVTSYVAEDVWKNSKRNRSRANIMFRENNGLSSQNIRKLVSADQHIKSDSPSLLLIHGDKDPTVPVESSRHLYKLAKDKGIDVTYIEVKDARHMLKPLSNSKLAPSMTWQEAQMTVVRHVLQWIKI